MKKRSAEKLEEIKENGYLSDFLNDTYNSISSDDDEYLELEPFEPAEITEEYSFNGEKTYSDLPDTEFEDAPNLVINPAKYSTAHKKKKPSGKLKNRIIMIVSLILTLAILYCVAIFSNIPFIAKWRTLYIETAMGTMTHQWLATAFIPESVIYKAMREYDKLQESQDNLETNWGDSTAKPATTVATVKPKPDVTTAPPKEEPVNVWLDESNPFYEMFEELDIKSFAAYMEKNEAAINSDGKVMIDESDRTQKGTSIRTKQGDEVLAIDELNGILIVKITGEGYMGRIAIAKDPSRVAVGAAKGIGSSGSQMKDIASYNNAVLAMNANGFEDPDGHGNGGDAYGYIVTDGKVRNAAVGGHYKVVGFDDSDRIYIGKYKSSLDLRDAAEFTPALIINGEKVVKGSAGWGIQPRSAIGQADNGDVYMLVIDGRQTHSIGATVEDTADQFLKYGVKQACNLDGGSSAVMYYNGRVISQPSAGDKQNGRRLPNGFIVKSKEN